MASTYTPIATTTLGSAQSSVTFLSIAGTYTDLVLVAAGALTSGLQGIQVQCNSDTGTNYSWTILYGDGSSAASARGSNDTVMNLGVMSTSQSNAIFNFQNYANTTTYKTTIARGNAASGQVRSSVGLWRNTSAINTIKLIASGDTFTAGSTFTLYGIKAA